MSADKDEGLELPPPLAKIVLAIDEAIGAAERAHRNFTPHGSSADLVDIAYRQLAKLVEILDRLREQHLYIPRDPSPRSRYTPNWVSGGMEGTRCRCGHVHEMDPIPDRGPAPDVTCPGCGAVLVTWELPDAVKAMNAVRIGEGSVAAIVTVGQDPKPKGTP